MYYSNVLNYSYLSGLFYLSAIAIPHKQLLIHLTLTNQVVIVNDTRHVSMLLCRIINKYKKKRRSKGTFLYSVASSPQDRSKRFTFYFPDIPVHSDTISASLGSIQPYATINARRLLVHISTTVYRQVLIYTAE